MQVHGTWVVPNCSGVLVVNARVYLQYKINGQHSTLLSAVEFA